MMMTSLFSIFDPSTSFFYSMNWMSSFIILLLASSSYWTSMPNYMMTINNLVMFINTEIKTTLGKMTQSGSSIFFITLFTVILANNFMGLLPYIFTSSSHLSFTLTLALPFWLLLILYSWVNSLKTSLAHLVPQGTPFALMMFMVMIESTSQVIRPITLAVRLMANMIAGHLLMTLVGNMASVTFMANFIGVMGTFIMLSILEIAVSMIQAYVFTVLLALYTNEAKDH
uniref:ATP synthase subunit a n=1 Tax=Lipothrix lubbocki TaxID=1387126 RepID=A0A6H0EWX2_9HEXA|nr:ATP synthase F0 subunit 6 [Lipothrix lubbocki]